MAFRISRIILFVEDVSTVAAFYETYFGLERIPSAEKGWIELRAGGCSLALHQGKLPAGGRAHSPAKIVFASEDVEHDVARLTAQGLKFGKVHRWQGIAFVDTKDPEGNPVQLSSRP